MIHIVLSSQRLQDVVVLNCSSLYFLSTVMLNSLMPVQRRKSLRNPCYILVNTLVLYAQTCSFKFNLFGKSHSSSKNCCSLSVSKNFPLSFLLLLISIYDNKSQVPFVRRRPCDSNKCAYRSPETWTCSGFDGFSP